MFLMQTRSLTWAGRDILWPKSYKVFRHSTLRKYSTRCIKGQVISKGLVSILNSSKNQQKSLTCSNMIPQVDLLSFGFWKN